MFDGTTKPFLPSGFIDRSEKNDICSHYELEVGKYIIAVWVNFDNPDRREEDWQYAVGIRKNEEDEFDNFVYFDEPNLNFASTRIFKEVSNLIRRYCMENPTHDKSFLFESLKKLSETQIGATRYFVEDNKILEGLVKKIEFTIQNAYLFPSVKLEGFTHVTMKLSSREKKVKLEELFKTKEEAAEQFLKDNDVPSELLKVLRQDKPKTTVGDLIERIQQLPPSADLAETFNVVLNTIANKAIFDSDKI